MFREEAQCFWLFSFMQVLWGDAGCICVSVLVVLTIKGEKYLHVFFSFLQPHYTEEEPAFKYSSGRWGRGRTLQ